MPDHLPPSSLTERCRGTEFDSSWMAASSRPSVPVSRSRALILIGLLGMATIYWFVLSFLGTG